MYSMQKAFNFLTPLVLKKDSICWKNLQTIYIGDHVYDSEVGNHLFLLYHNISQEVVDAWRQSERYTAEYDPTRNSTIIVLSLTNKERTSIIQPFIRGAYSQIDRDYVFNNFMYYNDNGEKCVNRMVLYKDPILKHYWENLIGVTLPKDAEVWSAPKLQDEIFRYNELQTSTKY